ncbi:MAG: ECF transporter S component [Lachnospiraceae bacterium]
MKHESLKKMIICALCAALCVVLPIAFHAIPNAGNVFCPMHIPVLLCGLIAGWQYGLVCGILGPVLSSVLTSMPAMAYLPSMLVELAVYGLVTGLMMKLIHTGKLLVDLYLSLFIAMLAGRIFAGVAKAFIFSAGSYTMTAWVTSGFITAFPGIAIQLVLIPGIVYALTRAKLIPDREQRHVG